MARPLPLLAALVTTPIACGVACIACVACVAAPAPALAIETAGPKLTHQAYVWQRAWTQPVLNAVREQGPRFEALRVLAAEIEAPGQVVHVAVPARALTGEVILVVRIDGAAPPDVDDVGAVVDEALASFAAVDVRGLELDHDCASARLPAYAALLASLRVRLDAHPHSGARLLLTITALPAWAADPSTGLAAVLAVVDGVVLQVHGVDRPEDGLFSSARARAFVDAFAPRAAAAGVEWRVALPAYGSALALDDDGRVRAVESEEQRAAVADPALTIREAWAEPAEVALLLRSLEAHRPRGLAGFVWFRLPVAGDRRAWNAATLEAVRAGADLSARFHVEIRPQAPSQPSASGALGDVVLVNDGLIDAIAPARVDVDVVALVAADGSNGYALAERAPLGSTRSLPRLGFSSSAPRRLAPAGELIVGWVRAQEVTAHASP